MKTSRIAWLFMSLTAWIGYAPLVLAQRSGAQLPPIVSNTQHMFVAARGGGMIATKDFIHNGITRLSPSGISGDYVVAGNLGTCINHEQKCQVGPVGNFKIDYYSDQRSFNIFIGEPLKQSRLAMEKFLLVTLGITKGEMCRLKYSVSTTVGEDYLFGGKELGFSFCPGAVALPNRASNRHSVRPG